MNLVEKKETKEAVQSIAGEFFTVRKYAEKNKKEGSWPSSEAAIWALRQNASSNGFGDGVFLKVGRRVLVSDTRFRQAMARLQEVKNASGK